ncbi:hypothetical protein OC844_002287 [Tilletia horrida]|nr:hypothetical protein OC844_002287 [Tilletia horrida]
MSTYYGVKVGRKPGVYTSLTSAEQAVKGFPGGLFRKFSAYEEAARFVHGSTTGSAGSASPSTSSAWNHDRPDGFVAAMQALGLQYAASPYAGSFPVQPPSWLTGMPVTAATSPTPTSTAAQPLTPGASLAMAAYCEGVCVTNGERTVGAGYGIFFEDPVLQRLNQAECLSTRNMSVYDAAMKAILRACLICPMPCSPLTIYTSNARCVKVINAWIDSIEQSAKQTDKGKHVDGQKAEQEKEHQHILLPHIERAFRARNPWPKVELVDARFWPDGSEKAEQLALYAAACL